MSRGERFAGRFDILDTAGMGAESTVYKVRDYETGSVLALKVYDDQYGKDPKRREAFLREVELGGKIDHRNVVRLFGAGESAGRSFILMEFLSGRTLAETLQICKQLSIEDFVNVFRQMAEALFCLHRHGIVHRDIKPGNLMFAADGTLKLMDFGIARRHGEAITVGVARGTVDYAAPEQLLGKEPTAASDVFALGAVSIELLTGQKPFRGQSQMERSTKAPPPIRAQIPGLSPALASAIEQCLQPDPQMRPATAGDLLKLAGFPVDVGPSADKSSAPPASQVAPPREPLASSRPAAVAPPPLPPARTIALLLGDEPRPPLDTLPLLLSLLSLLRRITDAGEAHDPVTPETVRLRPDGEPDLTRRPNPGDRDTWVISTPRFSAPELLRGATQLGDRGRAGAVLYSVGLVFYEILLGRKRFDREFRDVLKKNSDLAWMEWQVNDALRPQPLRTVLPEISQEVSTLFERLLEKDPTQRLSDYRQAEMEVRRLLQQSAPTEEVALPSVEALEEEPETVPEAVAPARMGAGMTVLVALAIATALLLIGFAAAWTAGFIEFGR